TMPSLFASIMCIISLVRRLVEYPPVAKDTMSSANAVLPSKPAATHSSPVAKDPHFLLMSRAPSHRKNCQCIDHEPVAPPVDARPSSAEVVLRRSVRRYPRCEMSGGKNIAQFHSRNKRVLRANVGIRSRYRPRHMSQAINPESLMPYTCATA